MILRPLIVAAALVGGCKARALEAPEVCPSWKEDVAELVAARCVSCHGGGDPAGGYDVSSYATAIDRDALGRLGSILSSSDAVHASFVDARPLLVRWAGECQVAYLGSSIHGHGVLDPQNRTDFHGVLVEQAGWRLGTCAHCHGEDFAGGVAKVACTTCHAGGPTACTTCHGNPPMEGAHAPHLAVGVACSECHVVPATYDAPGHPAPAGQQVHFGALANKGGSAAFDIMARSCSAVYCHGATLGDSAARNVQPSWEGGPTQGECGTCHGVPPSSHATGNGPCAACHARVVDADNRIANTALHVNGEVNVGDGTGTCTSCHGNASLSGAHVPHVTGAHLLRGPLACSDCHITPATVDAPGHIDSPPPAEVIFGMLARSDGAAAMYNTAARSCSAVYCHGGGTRLGNDTSPGLFRTPTWNGSADQATCGTCHGVPPTGGAHNPAMTLRDCGGCHSETVDDFGNILVVGGLSTHIDGDVDVD